MQEESKVVYDEKAYEHVERMMNDIPVNSVTNDIASGRANFMLEAFFRQIGLPSIGMVKHKKGIDVKKKILHCYCINGEKYDVRMLSKKEICDNIPFPAIKIEEKGYVRRLYYCGYGTFVNDMQKFCINKMVFWKLKKRKNIKVTLDFDWKITIDIGFENRAPINISIVNCASLPEDTLSKTKLLMLVMKKFIKVNAEIAPEDVLYKLMKLLHNQNIKLETSNVEILGRSIKKGKIRKHYTHLLLKMGY